MKTKQAVNIITIISMLSSEDVEMQRLGLALLEHEPIISNLNKHYQYYIYETQYMGFGSKPKWFDKLGYFAVHDVDVTITKNYIKETLSISTLILFHFRVNNLLGWLYTNLITYRGRYSLTGAARFTYQMLFKSDGNRSVDKATVEYYIQKRTKYTQQGWKEVVKTKYNKRRKKKS